MADTIKPVINELSRSVRERLYVPRDLTSFDDTYQRHTGVLDTLRP